MIKELFLKALIHSGMAPLFLKLALKVHNISYQLSGILSPALESDGLHPKHRLMRYHEWFTLRLKKEWCVLDIGCGNGALAYDMKSACSSVTGIDIEAKHIEIAKEKHSKEGISYICADALEYELESDFDAIVLSNVLEHIDNRVEFLERIYKKQGEKKSILLLRVPMITRDWISMYKKEIGVEWRLDHSHYTEYTLEEVFSELKQAGLEVESYEVQFGEFYGVVKKV